MLINCLIFQPEHLTPADEHLRTAGYQLVGH